ncbi:MAG: RDD family protein [Gammaproteobacteria bacterium]|nr:RDD family protein [Gammaproteobacteria bacterium]
MTAATAPAPALQPRAGLLRRLAALLYDAFLVASIWMLLGFLLQLIVGPDTSVLVDGRVQTDPLLSNILFVLMLGSCSGFYLWFWTHSGQTLGMLAWRIKLVNNTGQLITVQQGIVRLLAAWPAFFLLGLGYLWLYVDPLGDAVHDKFSKTRVIIVPGT